MIKSLSLKFGRASGQPPLIFQPGPVTVFVGPNNSGKSKILSEINQFCVAANQRQNVMIADVELEPIPSDKIEQEIDSIKQEPEPQDNLRDRQIVVGRRGQRLSVFVDELKRCMANPRHNINFYCQFFLQFLTIKLDGVSRIGLVGEQQAGDMQTPPKTTLQVLFRDNVKRAEVRQIIKEAFDAYFVIDPTKIGSLRIQLSDTAPDSELQERGLHEEAVRFQSKAKLIGEFSDGVKAYTGTIIEMKAGNPRILLIDEPEAFLHPSLSFSLAKEIARAAAVGDRNNVFISTHSPQFVMGCVQTGLPINIVRLTYRTNRATARLLSPGRLSELMRNPLLRSTGALSGLFYEAVVVTEADSDRAFYQEINDRLLEFDTDRGISNCLFINAQNKQTIYSIVRPLRELGIPAAAVVDIDIVKEGGSVWSNLLGSAHVPDIEVGPLSDIRRRIFGRLEATGKNMKRDGGVDLLSGADKEAAENLFERLAEYGIFCVPKGELETWLPSLGANGKAPGWLIEIFEKLGNNPSDAGYVKPATGDVWQFIGSLKSWFSRPDRKGIPN